MIIMVSGMALVTADIYIGIIGVFHFMCGINLHEGRGGGIAVATEFQKGQYNVAKRSQMPVLEPEARVTSFEEVQLGLTEEMAIQEAKRCLGCACIQACPYEVIQFDLKSGISHKCNLCVDRAYVEKSLSYQILWFLCLW